MNKAVHYGVVRKDANVVVDGRKSYNDEQCLSINSQSKLLIDLGEILSIHHITSYIKVETSGYGVLGIYIFFSVPVLFGICLHVNENCQLCRTLNINFLTKTMTE